MADEAGCKMADEAGCETVDDSHPADCGACGGGGGCRADREGEDVMIDG